MFASARTWWGQTACSQIGTCGGAQWFDNKRNAGQAVLWIRYVDELIDLKSYTQIADFGDFRFPNGFDFLVDLKGYIMRKSDFLIHSISL